MKGVAGFKDDVCHKNWCKPEGWESLLNAEFVGALCGLLT